MSCMSGGDAPYVPCGSGRVPADTGEPAAGNCAGMDREASKGCDLRGSAVLPGYRIFLFCLSETSLSDKSVRKISHRKCKNVFENKRRTSRRNHSMGSGNPGESGRAEKSGRI